jgi:hypothetical protein
MNFRKVSTESKDWMAKAETKRMKFDFRRQQGWFNARPRGDSLYYPDRCRQWFITKLI